MRKTSERKRIQKGEDMLQDLEIDVDPLVDLTNEHCSVCQCRLNANLIEPYTLQPGKDKTCCICFPWIVDTARITMQKGKKSIN